jgi:hypothetical protein
MPNRFLNYSFLEELDPVGQEDTDIDNDGKHNTKSDKYLLNRRAVRARKIVKNKKIKLKTESFSNWRQDLIEVVDDNEVEQNQITDKKNIKNKIKTSAQPGGIEMGEEFGESGGVLVEFFEVDEIVDIFKELNEHEISFLSGRFIDGIIEEVFYECLDDGHELDEIQESLIEAIELNSDILNEAKVTYGHDTKNKSNKLEKIKSGVKRVGKALSRTAGYVAGAAVRGAKSVGREFGSGYEKGRKSSSGGTRTTSGGTRTTSGPGLLSRIGSKLKRGLKSAITKGARSVSRGARNIARRMKNSGENIATPDKTPPSPAHSKEGPRTPSPYRSSSAPKTVKKPDPDSDTWKDGDRVKSKKTKTTKPKKKSSKLDDLISSIRNESRVYEAIVDQPTPADDQVIDKQSDTVKRQQLINMKKIQQKRQQLAKQTLKLQQQNKMPLHSDSYKPEGDLVDEANIQEKSLSKSQQRFMGMVYATKKGEKAPSPEVAKAAEGISKSEAKKFAETKHKGLPEKVKEDAQLGEATAAAKRGLREPHRSETLKASGKREADELRQTPRGRRELQRRSDYRRQKQTPEAQAAQRARDDESEKVKASNRRPLTTKQRAMSAAVRASGSLGT